MEKNILPQEFSKAKHESFWIDTTPQTNYPVLQKNVEADVVVIGAGIAGLTTAYLLKKAGKKVVVLEGGKIAQGVSGFTTAKITSLHTLIYSHLINQFGEEKAKQYGKAQQAGLEFIKSLVRQYKIDCDFGRVPAYTFAWNEEEEKKVKEEAEAALSLGLPASFVPKTDLPFKTKGAVVFANQARFHPRKYLLKLAELITDKDNYIFEESRVLDIKEEDVTEVITRKGKVKAHDVVIATNYPILDTSIYVPRVTPMRSYVLGIYSNTQIPDGMYISSNNPIFSIRHQPAKKADMIIITGEEHVTGRPKDTISYYKQLENTASKYINIKSIEYYWSTQDVYTIDMVPYIGKYSLHSKNLYVATGFGGWGMTNGTVAGIILSDIISGEKNPWQSVFDPGRIEQIKSAKQFVMQNVSMAKELIGGKLSKPEKTEIDDLEKNEGKIITKDGEKIAVFKDEKGDIVCLSPACTHMGCQVNFNNAEKSWDCPCHGSRFNVKGEVLHGPAVKPLGKK